MAKNYRKTFSRLVVMVGGMGGLKPKPCLDKVTRVLGRVFCLSCVIFNTVPLAVVMAEVGEEVLEKAILWLQKQQEKLRDGFSIQFQQEEYTFMVDYIDWYASEICIMYF